MRINNKVNDSCISINNETVAGVKKEIGNNRYEIVIRGTGNRLGIPISTNMMDHVDKINPGDEILTIVKNDEFLAVYCAIGKKFYRLR